MFIDGGTYVAIAFFAAVAAALSTDDAFKYIAEDRLFYMRSAAQAIGASLLALKMFRSTAFSDAKWDAKKKDEKVNGVELGNYAVTTTPNLDKPPLNPL